VAKKAYLVEMDEEVVEGFLSLLGTKVPEGSDGLDCLL